MGIISLFRGPHDATIADLRSTRTGRSMKRSGEHPMIKHLSIPAVIAVSMTLVSMPVSAQTGRAPCSAFQKLADGKWNVLKPVKIDNGKVSATVQPGTTIGPGTRVTGVDIYAALEKSCH